MSRRTQTIVFGALFAVLLIVLYVDLRPQDISTTVTNADERFTPANVDNPALRLDVLQHFLSLQYKGAHRNIFSAAPPPPPKPVKPPTPVNAGPVAPPPPPPLVVNAKYFGFVTDSSGDHRRAFFSTNNNEDVIIAGEGDTLLGRFRVLKLLNNSAEIEEISSGRRTTLPLEEAPNV